MRDVALIGCGHIAAAHLAGWRQTKGGRVAGVFDVTRALAEKRAAEFGVDKVYRSLQEAIESCQVIDVCTPPHTHAELAEQVLTAHKHLLIEKPLVTAVADWERIKPSLTASSICVVHNLKFTRAIQRAKQWVDDGRIGDVIRLHRLFLTSATHDRMLGAAHWSHALPGGRWFETLPHELYLTHMFAGPLTLASVTALHTRAAIVGAPADEVCIVLAGERAISTVHYSASSQENRRSLEIFGTKGKIEVDVLSDSATLSTARDGKWRRAVGVKNLETGHRLAQAILDRADYARARIAKETPHAVLIAAFDRHLAGEEPSPTPIDEIDYVVRNCELIGREIDRAVHAAQR